LFHTHTYNHYHFTLILLTQQENPGAEWSEKRVSEMKVWLTRSERLYVFGIIWEYQYHGRSHSAALCIDGL